MGLRVVHINIKLLVIVWKQFLVFLGQLHILDVALTWLCHFKPGSCRSQ